MYSKKTLKFAFSLDTGNGQIEELTLDNVKSFVRTNSYGGYGGVEAECALYGLSLELIGMLSPKDYSSLVLDGRQFDIAIYSGDILIFEGAVRSAYANMNTMPESPFVIQALAASDLRAKVIPPISRTGVVNVSDLLDSLCQQNGYTFQPNLLGGLTESNPYYAGSVFCSDSRHLPVSSAGISTGGKNHPCLACWENKGCGYAEDFGGKWLDRVSDPQREWINLSDTVQPLAGIWAIGIA
ncbi:hypothetical protein [Candidatus Arsenophonus triatominarum]|uniref:hypothetical protein n=1 Tax=Candidatus Arsenophonus triatominarum TaxID=57911 RepID=UPI0007C42C07|nr:hypothetical protein [Candidatus Arsenophonus triatominarum]